MREVSRTGGSKARLRLTAVIDNTFTDIAAFDNKPAGSSSERACPPDELVDGLMPLSAAPRAFADAGLFLHMARRWPSMR